MSEPIKIDYEQIAARYKAEKEHLFFTRLFFKHQQGIKFRVNWHHHYISDTIDKIIAGELKDVVFNVPPGSSKTVLVAINLMARGLAKNPRSRFLHLSYSDDLASLNSQATREIVLSDEYQKLWPLQIAVDSKSKKRWNIVSQGKDAGGVYATSLAGQVTGFRAGHMTEGFQGAIIIDDPLKPDDAFSKSKLMTANRKLLTTVKSRRATTDTPIIIIMQRIAEDDPTGFVLGGGLQTTFTHIKIPALIDDAYVAKLPKKYRDMIKADPSERDEKGRFSYWPYKEPLQDLLAMERGDGANAEGAKISRHVYFSQYAQEPVALGGNIFRGEQFRYYKVLPKIKYRKIYGDTAQKTAERNDFSVLECWGMGVDGNIYLLDLERGKWEAPMLQTKAIGFWKKHLAKDTDQLGNLREMLIEDKSSGTGLVQTLRLANSIPIKGIERNKDKLTRAMDALPYVDSGMVYIPEEADFTNDFVSECEAFSADGSHKFDDQVDPMMDAIQDMLSTGNKLKQWESLGK